jgi:hypothetical protein
VYSSTGTPECSLKTRLHGLLLSCGPKILAEDFNLDLKSTTRDSFKKFLLQHYSLRLATDPAVPTANENIHTIFMSNDLQVKVYKSYFSYHKLLWIIYKN